MRLLHEQEILKKNIALKSIKNTFKPPKENQNQTIEKTNNDFNYCF